MDNSRKCEGDHFQMKMVTLAYMVHHNIYLERGETLPAKFDLIVDAITGKKRDRATIRDILLMKSSEKKVKCTSHSSSLSKKN